MRLFIQSLHDATYQHRFEYVLNFNSTEHNKIAELRYARPRFLLPVYITFQLCFEQIFSRSLAPAYNTFYGFAGIPMQPKYERYRRLSMDEAHLYL